MVFVTHDITVARRAQRIGVMKNGRLAFKQPARRKSTAAQPTASAAPLDAEPLPTGASGLQPSDLPPADSLSFPD